MPVAACSGGSSDAPTSAPTSAAGSGAPANGAPSVAKPADVSKWQSNLCPLVPSSQVASYGEKAQAPAGRATTTNGAKSCAWDFQKSSVGVSFQTFHGQGLGSIYGMKNDTDVFTPYTVGAYPAVVAAHKGTLQSGVCDAFVAVRNDTVLDVNEQARSGSKYEKDPCSGAKLVAGWAMATITGK